MEKRHRASVSLADLSECCPQGGGVFSQECSLEIEDHRQHVLSINGHILVESGPKKSGRLLRLINRGLPFDK